MSEDEPEKRVKKRSRDECKSLISPVSEGRQGELNRHGVGSAAAANGSGPPAAEEHGSVLAQRSPHFHI